MGDLEIYDASVNVSQKKNATVQALIQSGECTFKLPPNRSGKLKVAFPNAYLKKPVLNVVPSINAGSVLDFKFVIELFNEKGFTIHLLNADLVNEMTGCINWNAQP